MAAAICAAFDLRRTASSRTGDIALRIAIPSLPSGPTVPASFVGLSYELAQLSEPQFFAAKHTDLVELFKRLTPSGALRIGGNSSEFCWFRSTPSTEPPPLRAPSRNPADNWMPHRLFEITPEAIHQLATFLDATGWTAIYGLNLGNSSPDRAAVEAAYVHRILGNRLRFFQIGNEPDLYHKATNGTRPSGWTFEDYVREWLSFAEAIIARVPEAKFGGPDTAASSEWVIAFGREVAPRLKGHLVALSGHYYAEGPPDDPRVTTSRLLAGDPHVNISTREIMRVANACGVEYRMTEGNSCYRGGKPGMSDAFASSLWAADYLLTLASLGCAGVNLHGGDSRLLAASLGDHNPGMHVPGVNEGDARNGFYTPIRSEEGQHTRPMPVFYGMLFAQQFAGATVAQLPVPHTGISAYEGVRAKQRVVALLNNVHAGTLTITLSCGDPIRAARVLRLSAPSLEATSGVSFGGAMIAEDGSWSPRAGTLPVRGDTTIVRLKGPSGAIVLVD